MRRNIVFLFFICAVLVATAGCSSRKNVEVISKTDTSLVSDKSEDSEISEDFDYMNVEYKGKTYAYNQRILTIMYAGIDSDESLTTYNRYSIAPRADAIELVIIDDYSKKTSVLAISRDTVTSVARYTMNGNYRDNYDTNIGSAYTYGDGGKVSCDNLIESVRNLIGGVPIHEYVITNNGSTVEWNNLVGGVTVTVPNDDLAEMYPEMVEGATVTLNADNVEDFVRWRDCNLAFTNNGRMERQKEFSSAFVLKLFDLAQTDRDGLWSWIEDVSDEYQTSIGRNQYLDIVERFKNDKFKIDQYYILQGENIYDQENNIDKFYVDEEYLMDTLVKLFYLEVE